MSLKIEFVERVERGEKVAPLCREFGISRTAGHKWIKRFKASGYAGLEEESRRPKSAPLATAEELVMAVLEARDAHPRWGPRKLVVLLRRRFNEQTPSVRTIARILKRANKVRQRRRRPAISVIDQAPHVEARAPNDIWTVDFKGWWRARDGERCEPLTVRDAFSRFVLALVLCSTTTDAVREVFARLFKKHGVPGAIQCDNGTPFVAVNARAGLSKLSAWWLSLGIRLIRSRPGCPQDNGGHERMHRDVRADVQSHPGADKTAEQRRLARWQQEFNQVRPHEALGGKTPADVYRVEEKKRIAARSPSYPPHYYVRKVYRCGNVQFRRERVFVGSALGGLCIGLEVLDALRVRAWLYEVDLGVFETFPEVDPSCFELPRPNQRRGAA